MNPFKAKMANMNLFFEKNDKNESFGKKRINESFKKNIDRINFS